MAHALHDPDDEPDGLYVRRELDAIHVELGPGPGSFLWVAPPLLCLIGLGLFQVPVAAAVATLAGVQVVDGLAYLLHWQRRQAPLRLEVDERGVTAVRHYRSRVFHQRRTSHGDIAEVRVARRRLELVLRDGTVHTMRLRHRTEEQLAWVAARILDQVERHQRFAADLARPELAGMRAELEALIGRSGPPAA